MQLTPEHDALRKTVRDFVNKEMDPFIDEWEAFTHPGGNNTEKINLPEDIQGAHIATESDSYLKIDEEYFYHKGVSL